MPEMLMLEGKRSDPDKQKHEISARNDLLHRFLISQYPPYDLHRQTNDWVLVI
jgi:hypothetical protein